MTSTWTRVLPSLFRNLQSFPVGVIAKISCSESEAHLERVGLVYLRRRLSIATVDDGENNQ